jgi:hypothetical protein
MIIAEHAVAGAAEPLASDAPPLGTLADTRPRAADQ